MSRDPFTHRKADVRLQILNPDGTPAIRKSVRADQVSHRFLFGCGAFDTVDLMKTQDAGDRAFLQERMEKWLALFNYGTLPFYWGRYEPVEGQTAYTETMAAARWLREKGVTVKGHPLCWHTACAPWLMQYSNEEILRRQIERIHRDMSAFKGVIGLWDVINDFNTSEAYAQLIEDLLEADVPIGAIGIQSHQHQGYWGAEKLHSVLERFSRFGLPIHFTENTLISGEIMPAHIVDLNDWQVDAWPSTPEGEDRQAREIAEMYSILFAHPLVEAITTWDFTDGCWLKAPSGFLREDNTEKPSWHMLKQLIHGDWETHETLTTDEEGYLSFTGFKGDYQMKTASGSGVFRLDSDLNSVLRLAE